MTISSDVPFKRKQFSLPLSHRSPPQFFSQVQVQGFPQVPCTQPGYGKHSSHSGPCQPYLHLQTPNRAWAGVCVCVCVYDISAQASLNWIYTIEHIYQTAVKPITSCQLSMIFHFLFIYTFEKSSIHTEILAILIVSHIAHLRYTSKFKRRKSEYHGDRSVNFFPVADTGHDLCLFSNLR